MAAIFSLTTLVLLLMIDITVNQAMVMVEQGGASS